VAVEPATEPGAEAMEATEQLPAEYSRSMGPVSVLQVRPDIYMLTVSGVNVAVETGPQGTLVVGAGPAENCQALVAAVKQIERGPIRFVMDTSADDDRVGCNGPLAQAGHSFAMSQLGFAAPVVAQNNVVLRLIQSGASYPAFALPSEVFTRPERNMYMNNQAVQDFAMPAAHTDGDSIVMFRRSDVVVAGDIFDETRFPIIDVAHGGSVDGEIAALNRLLDEFAVSAGPKFQVPGGTLIIPGRGQVCYEADVLNYRDMVTTMRTRVQALIDQHATLQQVEQSDPARGYDTRYGARSGSWTTDDFITAVYRSLLAEQNARHKR
jgi:glyoxylase-like metal-dependent hydrolase (beta-lactamase superfamily II)